MQDVKHPVNGQAYDVEVATFDPANVTRGEALNRIAARFIEGFARGNIGVDFEAGHWCEVDAGFFDADGLLSAPEKADSGEHRMRSPCEQAQHSFRIPGIGGLFEDDFAVPIQHENRCVGGQDSLEIPMAGGSSLFRGQASHIISGGFLRAVKFLNRRRPRNKGQCSHVEEVSTAGGIAREHELETWDEGGLTH